MNSLAVRQRAEAIFKKKERALLEGQKAMQEYEANIEASRQKTARPGSFDWPGRRPRQSKRRQTGNRKREQRSASPSRCDYPAPPHAGA
jgi:hypothetical protein